MSTQIQGSKRRSGTSNDTPGKRSRVSRACDQCRTAREKCDGVQPTCFTCASAHRSCTYTAEPKKRGIQPGYIRTLELSLSWLFNNVPAAESSLNQKLLQDGSILIERDSKESNKLHKSWRKSRFCKDVDRLLSGGAIHQDGQSPESEDEESDTESVSARPEPLCAEQRSRPDLGSVIPKPTFLPANRWHLFDVYFAYTQSWFPIIEKHDVLKLAYVYPDEGLLLSPQISDSGSHAVLWAILAFASIQDSLPCTEARDSTHFPTPKSLYDVARALIPRELDPFNLNHVKALLILALINISLSASEAAWLLVGYAARLLVAIEGSMQSPESDPRFRHVYAGCFILDTLLSVQLSRRAYLTAMDLLRVGKIKEDGLEEWQPWTGHLDSSSTSTRQAATRSPAFILSSFNNLTSLIQIFSHLETSNAANTQQEMRNRIEMWKAGLAPAFDYIRRERMSPSIPPATLLHVVYLITISAISSSAHSSQRLLEVLERSREVLGMKNLPPILLCLLDVMERNTASTSSDQGVSSRLRKFRFDMMRSWSWQAPGISPSGATQTSSQIADPANAHSRMSLGSSHVQMPTPESIHIPFNTPSLIAGSNPTISSQPRVNTTFLEDLLPDMSTTRTQIAQPMEFSNGPGTTTNPLSMQFDSDFNSSGFDPRNAVASKDLESFFDELASLDGADKIGDQPQFMQNLGFAPDANIADLLSSDFGQLNPIVPPYMPQAVENTETIDHTAFFDGG